MASSGGVDIPPKYTLSDGDKLRALADWLDRLHVVFNRPEGDEVPVDLRRMAERLDNFDGLPF